LGKITYLIRFNIFQQEKAILILLVQKPLKKIKILCLLMEVL